MNPRNPGDGGYHHAGKQLHGGYVALIKGAGGTRQNLEDAQGAAIVAQGGNQYGADSEAAAAGQIDPGIPFGVVAEHDFAGADGFGGDAGVGLQANTEVGGGASGAGAAD